MESYKNACANCSSAPAKTSPSCPAVLLELLGAADVKEAAAHWLPAEHGPSQWSESKELEKTEEAGLLEALPKESPQKQSELLAEFVSPADNEQAIAAAAGEAARHAVW